MHLVLNRGFTNRPLEHEDLIRKFPRVTVAQIDLHLRRAFFMGKRVDFQPLRAQGRGEFFGRPPLGEVGRFDPHIDTVPGPQLPCQGLGCDRPVRKGAVQPAFQRSSSWKPCSPRNQSRPLLLWTRLASANTILWGMLASPEERFAVNCDHC